MGHRIRSRKILYSDEGLVLQDLDGDDDLQTGWT